MATDIAPIDEASPVSEPISATKSKSTVSKNAVVVDTQVLAKKEEKPPPTATFRELFLFADSLDYCLIAMGCLAAAAAGACMPLFALIFGQAIDAFVPFVDMDKVFNISMSLFGLAIGVFSAGFVQYSTFAITSERQMKALRKACLTSVLSQEMAWFDSQLPGTLAARIAGDALVIQEGISVKLGQLVQFTSGFIAGFVIGFLKGWELALVMCASMPILAVCMGMLFKMMGRMTERGQEAYAKAGAIAEETLSSMRTTAALNGEQEAVSKYSAVLAEAEKVLIKSGIWQAAGLGMTISMIFYTYALGMWYGGKMVSDSLKGDGSTSPGDVFSVFYAVMMGSMFLGQAGPNMNAIASAKGAAANIISILKRKPEINALDTSGERPETCKGRVEFKDVTFFYPSRPDVKILRGYNLTIEAGETVALVGGSGGGKSTIVSLLERFYNPQEGEIFLDGQNIKKLNLHWLRSQMGLVGQEPILFAASVLDNIRYGRPGATREEVEQAARSANAYDFIQNFPKGFDTFVGEKGIQLSGGQKQRVAIARAILRDPTILLLDEATSALDNESERVVQEALDRLVRTKKRTTIVIAHRLSTIRNAHQIAVVKDGAIAEKGTHDELIGREGGLYQQLVAAQESKKKDALSPVSSPANKAPISPSDPASLPATPVETKSDTAPVSASVTNVPALPTKKEESSGSKSSPAPEFSMSRLWALNRQERGYLVIAYLGAALQGFTFPLSALLIAEILGVMQTYYGDPDRLYSKVSHLSSLYVALGAGCFVSMFGMLAGFNVMGERLTTRLRDMTFKATVRQDIGFFDQEKNNTGALCSRLSTDATLVKAIAGENQGRMVQTIFTFAIALVIAFAMGSWQLTLVILALLPLLVAGSMLQMRVMHRSSNATQQGQEESGKIANESISAIRTVAAFSLEETFLASYEVSLLQPMKEGFHRGLIGGASAGASQLVMFGGYALVFYYGGTLIRDGTVTFEEMMKSLMAIMMAAQGMGQTASFMGDTARAKAAAGDIFALVDKVPAIDSFSSEGEKPEAVRGEIEAKGVTFSFPTRPEVQILRNYNLKIEAGETVALVGSSGGGKSTLIYLLERFYDPQSGSIYLDGRDIRSLSLHWLRSQIGLVSQEPILYAGTIAENIAAGKPGASQEEIEEAAKKANAFAFIQNFPDKFQTQVGNKGTQLSGGQKQRIAIARAIIKDPSILLLDEATSALDSESERVVQEALDKLLQMKKRTTLVIAHRLSTIINSDKIAFIHKGNVAELGTHAELLEKKGLYAKLYEEKSSLE